MICRGCRKSGKSNRVLEPFRYYRLSWTGRSDLKTLTLIDELPMPSITANADRLYCGFYLNELLRGVIRAAETEQELFDLYHHTLVRLAADQESSVQPLLRYFELSMIRFMGYGISLEYESDGETPISVEKYYGLNPDQGFYVTASEKDLLARGDSILALQTGSTMSARQEKEARNLTRALISYYLPDTAIQSRKFFKGHY
jgi:DNA repair protein RecO (recombination protein O)